MARLRSVLPLALLVAAPLGAQTHNQGPGAPDDSLRALYEGGVSFPTFLENARRRKTEWESHYAAGVVTGEQLGRAGRVDGVWRLLVVAEDWCGDSANTIPYVARLVEQTQSLDMRVVSSSVGRGIMEGHRTPDGRAATPTILLLDAGWNEVGCFVERPGPLMEWYLANRGAKSSDELHDFIFDWYADDAGASTVDQILGLLEAAAAGAGACAGGPG